MPVLRFLLLQHVLKCFHLGVDVAQLLLHFPRKLCFSGCDVLLTLKVLHELPVSFLGPNEFLLEQVNFKLVLKFLTLELQVLRL